MLVTITLKACDKSVMVALTKADDAGDRSLIVDDESMSKIVECRWLSALCRGMLLFHCRRRDKATMTVSGTKPLTIIHFVSGKSGRQRYGRERWRH